MNSQEIFIEKVLIIVNCLKYLLLYASHHLSYICNMLLFICILLFIILVLKGDLNITFILYMQK